MVKCPLEQVIGGSFRQFLSDDERAKLRPLLRRPGKSGSKIQVTLKAGDGSQVPAQISIRPLARNGSKQPVVGMVVTDTTEARRKEELLRALSHRLVEVQEAERGRVAIELHDHITQLLCGIVVRCQILVEKLPTCDGSLKTEGIELRTMLGKAAEEVERISRDLRPSVLTELGLVAILRETTEEFAARTGVSLTLDCVRLFARLSADTELTLYRILQEALKNVEKHARARHISVSLRREGAFVQLVIRDDGIGFDADDYQARQKGKGRFGLLSMRERANYAGGAIKITSDRRAGTEIEVRIPVPAPRR
jgi:signal transduction histidine kinase